MNNPLAQGTSLKGGTYHIQGIHKVGGQSIVYQGLDTKSGQQIIIKQNNEDQEWSHEVLRQEAILLGSLHHKSLPRCLDYFSERGSTFLIMSRVPGSDVGEILKRRGSPLPIIEVLGWAGQLLDILDYLQAQEPAVIHRDINPKNVRLTPEGQIFLLDFGIAKRNDLKTFLTGGTPRYSPPEQLKDEGTDLRSDLYALAATLYYLLTTKEPPDSLSRESAVMRGLPDPLRPACDLNVEIPPLISQVLSRALSLNREYRPSSAVIMRQWLSGDSEGVYFDEEVTQTSPSDTMDPDTTRVSVRVVVPVDTVTHRDATPEANQLIELLDDGFSLAPALAQILIEMMDSQLEERKTVFGRYTTQLSKNKGGKSQVAINLIRSLASDSYIAPEVRKSLRQKLGRSLANHALSGLSAGSKKEDVAEAKGSIRQPDASTAQRYINHRNWLKEIAIWLIRGIMVAIAAQLILTLFTSGQTVIDLLSADNTRDLWAAHILLTCLSVTLVIQIRRMRDSTQRNKGKLNFSWQFVGFCLGVFLAVILFHDFMLAMGLT